MRYETSVLLSLVIPAWQEAARFHVTVDGVDRLRAALPYPLEVIVVDDGSSDGTSVLASDAGYKVIRQAHRGKGAAVRTGMLAASGMYRMVADADWSMPPEQALMMLPPAMTGFDIAIASRELPGAHRSGEPLARHLVGRAFNRAVQNLVLPGINDTQCGFKVFRAEAARAIFSRTREDGWAFDVEALALARAFGLRINEVPIDWAHDRDSRVHPVRDAPGMLAALLRIRTRLAMSHYPDIRGGPPVVLTATERPRA
jgi:glycosyltransferase involved in cell wall biosynthesis